jgi:hypothetical protein
LCEEEEEEGLHGVFKLRCVCVLRSALGCCLYVLAYSCCCDFKEQHCAIWHDHTWCVRDDVQCFGMLNFYTAGLHAMTACLGTCAVLRCFNKQLCDGLSLRNMQA